MTDICQYFNKVVEKDTWKYECKYCGHRLANSSATKRLRAHLTREPNAGTKSCPNVPDDVRISLCEFNKRQKTPTGHIPRSSNHLIVETEGTTVAPTSVLQPFANNYLGNQGQENHLRDRPIFSPLYNHFDHHTIMPPDPNESASFENFFTNFPAVEQSEVVNGCTTQPVERGSTQQPDPLTTTGLTVDADQHGVGDAANQTGSNRVSPTADVLTDEADQNGVQSCEGRVHVEVPSEEVSSVQRTRREGIVQRSNERHRSSDEVTVQQAAQMTRRESSSKKQALCKKKSWILFSQELGNCRTEMEELAKAVSRECAGSPLVIRVTARKMNGICDANTWRKKLEELKESKSSEALQMREEVLSVLKTSYHRLKDSALKECLSYCALFPKDAPIGRNDLIEYMIVAGIIVERKSRQAELEEGLTMLDTLENECLLEGDTKTVWMHHRTRDMVNLEFREGSKTLVEEELPGVEKWTENLVSVSLMHNGIEVIPSSYTPRCPNLSTLLLCTNRGLRVIAGSFFVQFQRLKVLDLSWCDVIEKLPRSISDLVNLTALLLRECKSLIHVPLLSKLQKLKKLDLGGCKSLEQMPEGVRFLSNLKYLDLSRTGIEKIESGIIPMLSQLQVLKLCDENGESEIEIRGSEVGELRMLETLYCRFSDPSEFVEYMKSRARSQQSPSDCSIFIMKENALWPTTSKKFVSVNGCSNIDILASLPTDTETLNIYNFKRLLPLDHLASYPHLQELRVHEEENGEWREFPFSNHSIYSYPSLLHLKLIKICNYDKLKKLFPPCFLPNLPNLQIISVEFCSDMEEIFSTDQEEEEDCQELHLSRLTKLKLRNLEELRSIYKGAVICQSLQEIELLNCPKLQRINLTVPVSSLESFRVCPEESWDSLQWGSAEYKKDLGSRRKR